MGKVVATFRFAYASTSSMSTLRLNPVQKHLMTLSLTCDEVWLLIDALRVASNELGEAIAKDMEAMADNLELKLKEEQ